MAQGRDFKHAPEWLKKCCNALHIAPTRYSVTDGSIDADFTVMVWNSKTRRIFNQSHRDYATKYL